MKKFLKIVFILLILLGCKKDKLVGDYSILEGNWRWTFSVKRIRHTINQTIEWDTIKAGQYPDIYEVEFEKKGKILIKKNGETVETKRVVFTYFNYEGICTLLTTNAWRFGAQLNNREKYPYNGCVNQDTLIGSNKNLPDELNDYTDYPYEVGYFHFYTRN